MRNRNAGWPLLATLAFLAMSTFAHAEVLNLIWSTSKGRSAHQEIQTGLLDCANMLSYRLDTLREAFGDKLTIHYAACDPLCVEPGDKPCYLYDRKTGTLGRKRVSRR